MSDPKLSNHPHQSPPARPAGALVDPRGLRFVAGLTTVVLALVLITQGTTFSLVLLAGQTVVFALGAIRGPAASPYAWVYARLVRPRIGPPAELEPAAPPRFAQALGLTFALIALAGYASGALLVGAIAIGLAVAAAFLNAAFGLCLGCEMYLLARRVLGRATP